MGVKTIVKRVAGKAGDRVASLSSLSPQQVAEVQAKRESYLLEMTNPNDGVALETSGRLLAASSVEIFNAYLPQIKDLYLPIEKDAEYDRAFDPDYNIRYFNITKWVTCKEENSIEKLINVYAVLADEDCNIALVFNRTRNNTNVYLAVVNNHNSNNNTIAENYKNRLMDAIRGNFPGAEWGEEGRGIIPCLDNDRDYSVAMASNIPTEKSEKFVSQTIEKLLDGIVPDSKKKEYTIVLLATPIKDVEERKMKLGEFHSGLTPYATWSTSFQLNETNSTGSTATVGVNIGASAGIQNGQNSSQTESDSVQQNKSQTNTESRSRTETDSTSVSENSSISDADSRSTSNTYTEGSEDIYGAHVDGSIAVNQQATVTAGGGLVPGSASATAGVTETLTAGVNYSHGINSSMANTLGQTATKTLTQGLTNTVQKSLAQTTGTSVANTLGKAVTKAMANTSGISKAINYGANFGANFARSSTVTAMIGKSESINQNFENYNIKHALELLENQMKRLEQSTALGMWDFAAYVLSEDHNAANNVAHTYLALTLGEESYMSKSAINIWRGNFADKQSKEERESAKVICDYIRELRHPVFGLSLDIVDIDKTMNVYPSVVTATTSLSGKELAYSLNFPQKSISGLPILECAQFGRNVVTYDTLQDGNKLSIGNIFHMNHIENNKVELYSKSLASHTFITGSTGSGKSNTVYTMLNEVRKQGVKFLVVEPAKGEYKHIFGNDDSVSVYGTNPSLTPMLRINPFSFPEEIHVLEHLDRLIEIFNVCWPMYAAMPAVLKSAVEKSYKDCGWDMVMSINKYGDAIYPTFADVAKNIKEIIDNSEFDTDNKGAYKGSLLTRLESLTNGINGMIFTCDEISNEELFDNNVIVDLSRVGSAETKSFIMGMMVLKLQEYRMSSDNMNAELKHVTVLEEAHNLLKRTSTEQSSERSNLLGKSVEMLANAIAEMRTYGEGFIIADQAPGLLDMSVIRNTNTKIIMRLPDQTDRELVGKAANLNENQIVELAKLPCGVAAIYQNEWVQPVLCKVSKYDSEQGKYEYKLSKEDALEKYKDDVNESLLDCIMNNEITGVNSRDIIKSLRSKVVKSKLPATVKKNFIEYIDADDETAFISLRQLIYEFFAVDEAIDSARHCTDITDWIHTVVRELEPYIEKYNDKQIDLAMALILYEHSERNPECDGVFCRFTEVYQDKGGVY